MSHSLIASQTASGSVNTITFSSLPTTFKDFVISIVARSSSSTNLRWRVNGDTGANYNWIVAERDPSFGTRSTSITSAPQWTSADLQSTWPSLSEINLFNVNDSTSYLTGLDRVEQTASSEKTSIRAITHAMQLTVSSLTFYTANGSNFVSGSTFTIYGIEG